MGDHISRPVAPTRPKGARNTAARRSDRRARLVDAALEVFATRGFAHTSVDDIVRRARTSRTVFYEFFENREACMLDVLHESLDGLLGAVRKAVFGAGADDVLEVGLRAYVQYLCEHPHAARVILVEAAGTSADVDELRSSTRRELADLLQAVWALSDPETARAPETASVAIGLVGAVSSPMVTLLESDRLDEAPAVVPILHALLQRVFSPETEAGTAMTAGAATLDALHGMGTHNGGAGDTSTPAANAG